MKRSNLISLILSLAAIVCFVLSIIKFAGDGSTAAGFTFMTVGGVLLCFGAFLARKGKKDGGKY